jgi:hypothetical protein
LRSTVGVTRCDFEVGGAEAAGGQDSNFGKVLLVVCTVSCICGSTDRGENRSGGRGGWCLQFSMAGVPHSIAHPVTKPSAKTLSA